MISGECQNWAGEAAQFFGGESHIRLMIRAIQRKITAGNGKVRRGRNRQIVNPRNIAAEQIIPRRKMRIRELEDSVHVLAPARQQTANFAGRIGQSHFGGRIASWYRLARRRPPA